jgi:WD40 repeat protein
MTIKKNRRRGVVLSLTGQRKLEATRRELEKTVNNGDRFTLEQLSERTRIAVSTITRVVDARVGVDKVTLDLVFAAFDLLLEQVDYQQPGRESALPLIEESLTPNSIPAAQVIDWGEAIDVSMFYGRSAEIDTLATWIERDRCRLIALLGMGGIGKTALSVKLAQQLATANPPFEFIIWRTLRNAPPLELLLTDLIQVLSVQQENLLSVPIPTLLNRFLHYLRQHRCLLILDNGETLLQSGEFTGIYRQDYKNYDELFRQVGEISHQSCMVLTSREKPETIANQEGISLPVRSFALPGLEPTDSDRLFAAVGLSSSPLGRHKLTEVYSGNPLALKIVATSIREIFDGDVDAFLTEEATVFNGIRRLLDQQCQRMKQIERQVMTWLAIDRDWVTIAELQADIVPSATKQRLMETLESLARRNLIEQKNARFTQQPVVMEYMTEQLVNQICTEIVNQTPDSFNAYALVKTTVKEYIRESQIRLILQPIASYLRDRFSSSKELGQQMQLILQMVRHEGKGSSYGAGNLLNLMTHLKLDLTGYDFADLTIRQAYLQNTPLHQVNLSGTQTIDCRFADPVTFPTSLAISPNGELLAVGGEDGIVQMWPVATGQSVLKIQAHTAYVFAIAFSPDGQTLASGSLDGEIKFWDVKMGSCQKTWQQGTPWSLAFSPDGKFLAAGLADSQNSVRVWDCQTGECLKHFTEHTGQATRIAFAPRTVTNGKTILVTAGLDGLVKIWDVDLAICLHTLTKLVGSVSFHPEGDRFATANFDHSIAIWDVATGNCLQALLGHTSPVTIVSFSPDGQLLASSSIDHSIAIWDMATGQCLKVLQGHTDIVWLLAFAAGYNSNGDWVAGQMLASVSFDRSLRFWDVSRTIATTTDQNLAAIFGHCLKTIHGNDAGIRSIASHPHRDLIASGGLSGVINLWDRSGKCLNTLTGHTASIYSVAFHPHGDLLASASFNGEIKIWELTTGRCLHSLLNNKYLIQALGFSSQGCLVSGTTTDYTMRFWDTQTGECWQSIVLEPEAYLLGLDFHPQGQYLVTAGGSGQICWWDLESGKCFRSRSVTGKPAFAIAFHPQGHLFASLDSHPDVKIWDAETGECVSILQGHQGILGSIAFSPDGLILASGRSDCTIRLWNVATGECLHVLAGHTSGVTSVSFLPIDRSQPVETQPQILASGSYDGTIRLWDVKTGECLKMFRPERLYEGMKIAGITGLTPGSISTLKSLGAIDL